MTPQFTIPSRPTEDGERQKERQGQLVFRAGLLRQWALVWPLCLGQG